ncbi:MAG: hypothetical protein K5770_09535 [Lachnospiraceae bacterium]|nr:hypothetical protein [Lachnospiraceae bacterium]
MYTEETVPKFRDADADGLLGIRGYFNLLQDLACIHMYRYDLGNDKLPERTGCAWIFTKYKIHVYKKADFDTKLRMETWLEPVRSPLLVNRGMWISAGEELYAAGRVETCPFNLREQKLVRLSEIGFKGDISFDRQAGLTRFSRMGRFMDDLEFRYEHVVRYTDLDKSMHMNNIRYVDMFLNAFPSDFYRTHFVNEMEVQFRSQCFEGERLRIFSKEEERINEQGEKESVTRLHALKDDDSVASVSLITALAV